MEKHPLHLKNPELQKSPEVERAVKREEHLSGEKIPNDPTARIETYMDRLEAVFLNKDERTRERNLDLLRPKIHNALLIKPENFPDSYFELQQRIARERGQPVEHIPENIRAQMIDTAIEEQRHSLDAWIDYLTSPDAVYPTWFKYLAWNNISKLSQFDKERGEFKKRTASTVASFPDIYREPLAQMADMYEKIKADNKQLSEPEIRRAFEKKFPALYAELIQKSLAASMESREQIQGEWVKYVQGEAGAAEKLFQSLEGKGTGWCTAGRSTAETQIESGDFYVYYTYDSSGTPTQPRLAIRMDGQQKIGEVRGILPSQNVEPLLQPVLDEKLKDFGPEADRYRKKSADMKKLTAIDEKCIVRDPKTGAITERLDPKLTREELTFLYELDSPIESFGYREDPRIKELREGREVNADLPILFDCAPSDIAHTSQEIKETTKAYVGPLTPGIFDFLPDTLEHVYTKFPGERIRFRNIELSTDINDGTAFKNALEAQGKKVDIELQELLESPDFKVLGELRYAKLVEVSVASLGLTSTTRLDAIYARAKELSLDLCPAEVCPQLRLQYSEQHQGEWLIIAMDPLINSDGKPYVFLTLSYGGGLWRQPTRNEPGHAWRPNFRFVFLRPRKSH